MVAAAASGIAAASGGVETAAGGVEGGAGSVEAARTSAAGGGALFVARWSVGSVCNPAGGGVEVDETGGTGRPAVGAMDGLGGIEPSGVAGGTEPSGAAAGGVDGATGGLENGAAGMEAEVLGFEA